MKNLLLVILASGFCSLSAQISFNTGNSQLDSDLMAINASASADPGSFKADMKLSYNLSEQQFDYMNVTLHMAPGEVYLALEISRIAKISVDDVLSHYKSNKSKGWGYIANQAGIKPGSEEFHQLKNNTNSKKEKGPGKTHSPANGNKKEK